MTDCIEVRAACVLFVWSNHWTNEGRRRLLIMYELFSYFNSFLTIIKRFYRVNRALSDLILSTLALGC